MLHNTASSISFPHANPSDAKRKKITSTNGKRQETTTKKEGPDAIKSKEYWDAVEPTVNGMLGGFSRINHVDIQGSKKFLQHFFNARKGPGDSLKTATCCLSSGDSNTLSPDDKPTASLALDCGAGIGRISKHLLLKFASRIDLLEQAPSFLNKASEYIGVEGEERIERKFLSSLQAFTPEPGRIYDIIWVQWVTGYLTDKELVDFLLRISRILHPTHGIIVVKDNTTRGEEVDTDVADSSVTRPKIQMIRIFGEASLSILLEKRQAKFPRGLYPVYMWALKPKRTS